MRNSNLILALGLSAMMALPAAAQTSNKFQSLSRELVAQATVALHAEKPGDARLLFERALVADPANVAALVGLGQTAEAQGLTGRGLKYYRRALEIEPNHKVALEAQALAFLKRDMADRAEGNRDKLARLCMNGCEALTSVTSALEEYHAANNQTAIAQKEG
ncbi:MULTISPECIES: tetratricopeptide repeat protein [Kordiimonas]|jgi:tetratricopeptide (TPR) repeat protein|uniref:tetratricopeptide repeat protein n=1 Tax=Kordiimonas TaxID=288021 RepID=UPI0025808B58|nr:tetratricopeptide repeat protein [Kordiimonas sp. UBA4487]